MGMNNCHIKVEQETTNDSDEPCTMSSFPSSFDEIDEMFLEFIKDLNNTVGGIPMSIDPGVEEPISPQAVSAFFVLDFNDHVMNRFVEHQMLTTFKEFRDECYKHFKKYNDPKEARVNTSYILVGHMEDWQFLCDHYMSRAFQFSCRSIHGQAKLLDRSNLTVIATGQSCFYNDNTSLLSNEPTLESSQPLSRNEICETWGPKPKSYKMASAGSSLTSCLQSTEELQLQVKLDEAK
ncbi:CACTA en-spm transposon protein [Cucumis melo var. makuwa]|uniref:CACTA en-spm transposon protein n=1 Tax=Cucumis melo var. makuwa TaxID=1194695 RepID=A0A5D3BVI3_CUCMM|nr:CACTA en-spm transposon protein [Cucumis melo var. makuwa]